MTDTLTSSPSRQRIKISGFIFDIPKPYAEGHVCNDQEAKALNQTFAENIRNNCANIVKKAKETAGEAELSSEAVEKLRTEIQSYADSYQFSSRTRVEPIDPVVKEARKLAADAYRAALRGANIDPKTVDKEVFESKVDWILENRPAYMEEAARRVSAAASAAQTSLEELISPAA